MPSDIISIEIIFLFSTPKMYVHMHECRYIIAWLYNKYLNINPKYIVPKIMQKIMCSYNLTLTYVFFQYIYVIVSLAHWAENLILTYVFCKRRSELKVRETSSRQLSIQMWFEKRNARRRNSAKGFRLIFSNAKWTDLTNGHSL